MLEVKNIFKEYRPKKGQPVKALDGVSIKFPERGLVFILGKSGSGKSTLLNVLGGLDQVDSGEIVIKGKSSKDFSQSEFDSYRNTYLGFIFQEYNILNEFNVGDNISLALQLQGKKADQEAVGEILHQVDLEGYAKRKPMELSGGQKQRVAIARALIKNPDIILADEPTGALDSATGIQVFDTLKKLSKEKLIIVVSHDRDFAERYGDRVIELKDGQVLSDEEKVLASGKTISEGMVSLSDKVFTFQKGHKLTEEDVIYLNKILEEQDAILSADPKSNKAVKEATHLSEGNEQEFFQPTDEKKIVYQDESFRLIKSRLPLGRAIKMGGSALKSKPIRLFFTVLLSSIAFVLFGCVATMAAFNKADSIMTGLQARPYHSGVATFLKKNVYNNGYVSYNEAGFGKEQAASFGEAYGLAYDPLISGSSWGGAGNGSNYLNAASISNSNYSLYSQSAFGFLRKSPEEIEGLGYSLLSGRYPSSADELLMTDYTLLSYKKAGYIDYSSSEKSTLKPQEVNENSILGKRIYASPEGNGNRAFTVVGVLNTNLDYEATYPDFAKEEIDMGVANEKAAIMSEINYRIKKNYPNCFYVAPSFVSKKEVEGGFLNELEGAYLDTRLSYQDAGGVNYMLYGAGFGKLSSIGDGPVAYFENGKQSLAKGEILVPSAFLQNFVDPSTIAIPTERQSQSVLELSGSQNIDGSTNWNLSSRNEVCTDFYAYQGARRMQLASEYCRENPLPETNADWVRYCQEYYFSKKEDGADGTSVYTPGAYSSFSAEMKAYAYMDAILNPSLVYGEAGRFSEMTIAKVGSGYSNEKNPFGGPSYSYFEQLSYLKSFQEMEALPKEKIDLGGDIILYRDGYLQGEAFDSFSIVGVFVSDPVQNAIVVDDELYAKIAPFASRPYHYLLFRYDNVSAVSKLVQDSTGYADEKKMETVFRFDNEAMEAGAFIFSIVEIFTNILLYVAIALAAFSALLMANFISTSISYKKREIGILRAVGARSSDVFSIFFSEASIIALIEFILSFFGTMALMIYFNIYISQETGIIGQTFVYGPLQWALMLGISLIVAFLASFLPVVLVAKKKPVDAIRAVV